MDMESRTCGMSTSFYNIIVHGLGFTCLFTAFQTSSMFQATVLEKQLNDKELGFQSLAIIYFLFAFAGFISPPIVERLGAKYGMMSGGMFYALFLGAFWSPKAITILIASACLGLAASVIWTAQGKFFTENSSAENRGSRSGIFWAMLQSSLLIGNLVGYFVLKGGSVGPDSTDEQVHKFLKEAHLFYQVLFFAAVAGVLILIFTRKKTKSSQYQINASEVDTNDEIIPVKEMILSVCKLIVTFKMAMIITIICYTGLVLTFWASQYPTLIANQFNPRTTSLSGMIVGSAEIIGGLSFGRLSDRAGRSTVVVLGMAIFITAFFLIYYNFESGLRDQPSRDLALACSFLLGLGDSAMNTNLIAVLSEQYKDQSSQAFAIYKGFQSLAAGIAFVYCAYHLAVVYQLLLLSVTLLAATWCFVRVDRPDQSQSAYEPIM